MKPDQWSAPGGMRSPSPLHKEKGSLPGGNGGTQVHPGAAQLGEARAQAGSCLPCPSQQDGFTLQGNIMTPIGDWNMVIVELDSLL